MSETRTRACRLGSRLSLLHAGLGRLWHMRQDPWLQGPARPTMLQKKSVNTSTLAERSLTAHCKSVTQAEHDMPVAYYALLHSVNP